MTQGTDRECARCGRRFHSPENLFCTRCRAVDRECTGCGKAIHGRELQCYECRATDRPCKSCGEIFHSTKRTCTRCASGKTRCQMEDCEEPKLRGQGYRYCAKHSAEVPQRERAQIVRRMREREYGITHAEVLIRLAEQDGVCAICRNPPSATRQLSVDHDHVTGQPRGLLCNRCNPMLGYARDDIAVLQAAIEYLKRYSGQNYERPPVEGLYCVIFEAALQLLLKLTGPPTAPSIDQSGRIWPKKYALGLLLISGYK